MARPKVKASERKRAERIDQAAALLEARRPAEALDITVPLRQQFPDDEVVFELHLQALFDCEDYLDIVRETDGNPGSDLMVGWVAAERGAAEEARARIEPVLSGGTLSLHHKPTAMGALINLLVAQGEKMEALLWMTAWREEQPGHPAQERVLDRLRRIGLTPKS